MMNHTVLMSKDIADWMQLADKVIAPTYTRFPVMLIRGKGIRVWASTGKEYLDFISGLGACNLGHCHPAVTEAVRDQVDRLIHVSNLFHIRPQIELAQ